ncbi:MAG: DUF2065 family protein [Elusimicrobiota bacterium]
MITLIAKVLSVLIIMEGIIYLLFPSFIRSTVIDFCDSKNAWKRKAAVIIFLLGAGLIYLTRTFMGGLYAHWVVAVCGVYFVLCGLFISLIPAAASKFLRWFYVDNKAVIFTGFVLTAGGWIVFIHL